MSNFGFARSVDRWVVARNGDRMPFRGQILQARPWDKAGHLAVGFWRDGKKTVKYVHHLVLEEFVGPRPPGLVGCHNNGSVVNNHVANLRWDTRSSNALDAVKHLTHVNARKQECPRGHRYSGDNLVIYPGGRRCRTCDHDREVVRWERKRAASH